MLDRKELPQASQFRISKITFFKPSKFVSAFKALIPFFVIKGLCENFTHYHLCLVKDCSWLKHVHKQTRGLRLPSCNTRSVSRWLRCSMFEGSLTAPRGQLLNLNYNYLNCFSFIALQFSLGFSLPGQLWWEDSRCVQEMRNTCPRPVSPL